MQKYKIKKYAKINESMQSILKVHTIKGRTIVFKNTLTYIKVHKIAERKEIRKHT